MATLNAQDEYIKTALRLPRDLHAAVQKSAEQAGRSMNAEIIARLELSFLARDTNEKLLAALDGFIVSGERQQDEFTRILSRLTNFIEAQSQLSDVQQSLLEALIPDRRSPPHAHTDGTVEAAYPNISIEDATAMTKALESVRLRLGPAPSMTPSIPGQNAPKRGLGSSKTATPKRREPNPKPSKKKVTE